ncbi:MAG: monovalent cation:proton antiporter-2 (CPA2) family protein [Burkholderiales bacterium]|jgi:glutathione-regulated potassium-efflux system ancillary protein KefC/glutathione-regulated potassium-efflux system protein KefB
MSVLSQTAVFLAAAVVAVPLFRRFKMGAVLGYLAAGVAIGPSGLGIISEVDSIMHLAELGIVMLLFVIGLELQPSRLWVLRKSVFGLGAAQVIVTAAMFTAVGVMFGLATPAAIVVGLALAMSSTAFVLQTLAERSELTTRKGRSSFAILLFQDIAVIPILALIPLLGQGDDIPAGAQAWLAGGEAVAVIAAIVFGGRYLLRPVFRLIAASGITEIFTAAALLVVIGTALGVSSVGLSMSLGAFLAGMLLADSEYRHELEANIEPFKGLLLGLFFISVGMSVDLALLRSDPALIAGMVIGLMLIKAVALFGVLRVAGQDSRSAISVAATLSQGGEFAFVIFGIGLNAGLVDDALVNSMIIAVIISMALTPLTMTVDDILRKRSRQKHEKQFDKIEAPGNRVIIAGFGRVGQIVARTLRARGIGFTALDISSEQIEVVRRFGNNKAYYGDASRLDMLHAAKADEAESFVLAIDDIEASVRTAETVRKHFPKLKILARARNRFHVYRLMDVGVDYIIRETLVSALELSEQVLMSTGISEREAKDTISTFRVHDERTMRRQHAVYHDETQLIQTSRQAAQELQGIFESDRESRANPAGPSPDTSEDSDTPSDN